MARDDDQLWLFRMERLDEMERQQEEHPWDASTVEAPEPSGSSRRAEGRPVGSNLSRVLPHMSLAQLTPILKRFAPGSRARRKAQMVADVERALNSSGQLDALIAGLQPLEFVMLAELKRRGGTADGIELVTFAVLRGHRLEPAAIDGLPYGRGLGLAFSYRHRLSGAVQVLAQPVESGLLLPLGRNHAWLEYGGYGTELSSRVTADQRLLDRLPAGEVPAVHRLSLDAPSNVTTEAPHPVAVVIELFDLLQYVGDEGGLPITRQQTIAKPFLRRLEKARPHLGDQHIETVLRLIVAMGLVTPPNDESARTPWQLNRDALTRLLRLPLFMIYASIVDASCVVRHPHIDRGWDESPSGSAPAQVFWRAVLDALPALPAHPVTLEEAASALWENVLTHVLHNPALNRSPDSSRTPSALTDLLAGPLARMGLIATDEGGTETAVTIIAPATGARLYARARALLHQHETMGANEAHEPAPIEAAPVEDRSGRYGPAQPGLLIQPNFEILAYLDGLSSDALAALTCATVQRVDAHTASFHLNRQGLARALDLGSDVEEVISRLEVHAQAMPENVAATLRDWAARRERLRVQLDVRVVEYATSGERDAALKQLMGARALGDRFLALDAGVPAPAITSEHDYRDEPERTLDFGAGGVVRTRGPLDLAGRAALQRVAAVDNKGNYRIEPSKIRGGGLTNAVRETLESRGRGGIPSQLDVLLRAWSGAGVRPTVAAVELFRHPNADAWAQQPGIAKLLGTQLSPSTFVVKPGKELALQEQLDKLGVPFDTEWDGQSGQLEAQAESSLKTGLSTRKKRELIEAAIEAGHLLELRYVSERERYDRYGSWRRYKGSVGTESVKPEEVVYAGSLPYLLATTVKRGTEREIRIGYIEAIGVRSKDL